MDKVAATGGRTRIQLCGSFAVELAGADVTARFPGRQGRILFAYLVLLRPQPVTRELLIDALWDESPPPSAGDALTVLISKLRTAVGADVIRGRAELAVVLPEPAVVDVEEALAAVHSAESALVAGDWRRAWFAGLAAEFVARRTLLPESTASWLDAWRRRLADVRLRALECYAQACLEIGGAELPGAQRAARELVELAPLRETGQLVLIRALAAGGNAAEALAAYERMRMMLRDELGVDPSSALQQEYGRLLG